MEKRSALYSLLVFGGLLGLCFAFLLVLFHASEPDEGEVGWGQAGRADKKKGPRVGVVEVSGVITESKDILGQLHDLRSDAKISAIVVRIDSPGGAVAPSQEIFAAIQRARKEKKVVCSMGNVAASGGYYIAAACDRIFASSGTITGSIGVISEFPHIGELLKLARVEVDTMKSGGMKDIGSPLRPMTAEEKTFFQSLIDGIHEQFITDVAQARKLDLPELRKIADGRILTGKQALSAHLIDELGTLEDAVEAAAKLAGQTGEPVPIFRKRPSRGLVGDLVRGATEAVSVPRGGIEARDPRL